MAKGRELSVGQDDNGYRPHRKLTNYDAKHRLGLMINYIWLENPLRDRLNSRISCERMPTDSYYTMNCSPLVKRHLYFDDSMQLVSSKQAWHR